MQTAEGTAGSPGHLVLVHDDMPLRRAQLTAFLARWAELERVGLVTAGMPGADDVLDLHPQCRMVVFSLGSMVFDRSPALHQVLGLAEQYPQVPAVILAEAGSARDAATAFQAGAKGYIPATIEPDVALHALSFILNGGHFFPPSALQMPRSGSRGGGDGDSGSLGSGIFGVIYRLRRSDAELRRAMAR